MSLMLEKLTVTDRQDILDQLYGKLYKSEQFKYFDEFRTNVLKLFLQIKQRQEEANDITRKKEEKLEKLKRFVAEQKSLELKFPEEMQELSRHKIGEKCESRLLIVREEKHSPEIQLME